MVFLRKMFGMEVRPFYGLKPRLASNLKVRVTV